MDQREKLTQIRQDLHRHPELGFKEQRTKSIVADFLRKLGIEVHQGAGVVGVLRSGNGTGAIGLRADMDALAIHETSSHDYRSTNTGVMHACGHDGHTTMLLGAAERLAKDMDFNGTVVFLFQPNEEHGLGARAMIDEGVLEQFPIDEVYAIHNMPGQPLGHVSTRTGLICSSESLFEIEIIGQGGHASMPQVGVDVITVGAQIVSDLQTIVSRKLAPGAGAVVSVTEFLTDGARNVLPGTATLKGDARARTSRDRDAIERHMRNIVSGCETAHGITAKVHFDTGFIETINAPEPTMAAARTARAMGFQADSSCAPMSFSEDFAHFCVQVPGCFLMMGNGDAAEHGRPLHSSDYDFNDALLTKGADFWAALVRDRLPKQKG